MRRLKKRILGALGIVAVTVMTLVAYSIPTNATEDLTAIAQEITISVYTDNPYIELKSFDDGEVFVSHDIEITYNYSSVQRIEVEIIKKNSDGTTTTVISWVDDFGIYDPDSPNHGTKTVMINLEDYGYGDYVVSYRGIGVPETKQFEDSISFSHSPVKLIYIGETESGEPIFDIIYNKDAANIELNISAKNGKPLFDPPIIFPENDPRYSRTPIEDSSLTPGTKKERIVFSLPKSLEGGEYSISSRGLDADGNPISPTLYTNFIYTPPVSPDVPNTGHFFSNLNIAATDYLITGLLIFFSASIFALFLINRRKNK